ncbi:hypothetical protein D3C79_758920 [compost metagenome]
MQLKANIGVPTRQICQQLQPQALAVQRQVRWEHQPFQCTTQAQLALIGPGFFCQAPRHPRLFADQLRTLLGSGMPGDLLRQ